MPTTEPRRQTLVQNSRRTLPRISRRTLPLTSFRILALLLILTLLLTMLAACSQTSETASTGAGAASTSAASSVTGDKPGATGSAKCGATGSNTKSGSQASAEYATKVFGTDIITLEITADPAEWQKMLDTATQETYIKADVVVNGTRFTQVGIRPKGNSSLRDVANSTSDRFSFRLKFDEYVEDQTCFGLDTFVVNNMFSDSTYLKEYLSYDLMRSAGVQAPLFGFTNISVNGKAWGLYLAVEAYNDSYQERVLGNDNGNLYNVKMVGGANAGNAPAGGIGGNAPNAGIGGNVPGAGMPDGAAGGQFPGGQFQAPGGQFPGPGAQGGQGFNGGGAANFPGGGRMGAGSSGGSLAYTDDNPASYKAIFENAVGKTTEAEQQRVIAALKALSTGNDLERYFDVDAILRYLAAHTLVVNLDSYSSMMAQNYYIYEKDGKLTILPWDYNMAWGGFQSGTASSVVNFPIDTPVSGVTMAARPLLDKLLSNAAYKNRYHQYLQQLLDQYFANGQFEAKVQKLSALIVPYVKADATAFTTYTEFEKGVSALVTLGNLRAQSVQGQLNGTVPATTADQTAQPEKLISAGSLNLRDLGTTGGNRNQQNPGGRR